MNALVIIMTQPQPFDIASLNDLGLPDDLAQSLKQIPNLEYSHDGQIKWSIYISSDLDNQSPEIKIYSPELDIDNVVVCPRESLQLFLISVFLTMALGVHQQLVDIWKEYDEIEQEDEEETD